MNTSKTLYIPSPSDKLYNEARTHLRSLQRHQQKNGKCEPTERDIVACQTIIDSYLDDQRSKYGRKVCCED